ncbi:uncharacterized protein HD556DRAFT_1233058, partial [Suillus plorans]
ALTDFHYLVQSPQIDNHNIEHISAALAKFHTNKHAITAAGLRRGQHNKPIDNWYIPKIELMYNIVPSICNTGITMQWSADATEHAHITEIKDSARSSNNNNYDSQICCHLDCADKCRRFDLATSLLDLRLRTSLDQHLNVDDIVDFDVDGDDDDSDLSADLLATVKCPGYACPITDYFTMDSPSTIAHLHCWTYGLSSHQSGPSPSMMLPLDSAFPTYNQPSLTSFVMNISTNMVMFIRLGGARRDGCNASLPFEQLQIWFKLWLQDTEFHNTTSVRPAQTLNCAPPSDIWPFGRYDTVIVNNEEGHSWPADGLCGHVVAQMRLILCPIRKTGTQGTRKNCFLTYVQHFNNSEHEPATQLQVLKRAKRSNRARIGDVIPVTQLRVPVNVVPHFGASADPCLTQYNSMELPVIFV